MTLQFYEDTRPKTAACLDVNVTGIQRGYFVRKILYFFVLNTLS